MTDQLAEFETTVEHTFADLDIGDKLLIPESHPRNDGRRAEIIDYDQPTEYGPLVYACADPETGDYLCMISGQPDVYLEKIVKQ